MESDSSPSEEGHIGKIELSGNREAIADESVMGTIRSLRPAETERKPFRPAETESRHEVSLPGGIRDGHESAVAGRFQATPNRSLRGMFSTYGSAAFWQAIEEVDLQKALPLEALVKCLRLAVANGDSAARNRIVEVIIRRTQMENEYWARSVLKYIRVSADELVMLAGDLYADLCECLMRALLDPVRLFWEENFQHCLRFERQHVYAAFMRREGRWNAGTQRSRREVEDVKDVEVDGDAVVPRRIPRGLLYSMDAPVTLADGEALGVLIEDEHAQEALQAIEHEDVPRLVLSLPSKLKWVVWLIFWEGRTEKDTAQVLGITDRTVRNRLREALKLLRDELALERDSVYE